MPSVLLIAAFDSQLKWAAHVGTHLRERGFDCDYVAPITRSALSQAQCVAAGVPDVARHDPATLVHLALRSDVVVLALNGPRIREFCLALADARGAAPGPVVVTGWVGIIIEKMTAGYLERCLADVVAVNAAHEMEHFRDVARRLDLDTGNLLLSGLPLLSTSPAPQPTGPVQTLVYADQPTVPELAVDRLYVYRRLLAYARRHPDRRVLLKPRHRIAEDTFHRMHHHPEELLAHEPLPPNFAVDHRPVPELLDEADLLMTVSSTACLEAVDRGCRVALVLDLGVHERLGNQVFLDSGLLRTFDQVEADDLGTPDPAWVDSWFGGRTATPAEMIADRVEKLLASGERPSAAVRDSAYQRAAREVQVARHDRPTTPPPDPWARRRNRYGAVKGTFLQMARWWIPPVLQKPLRAWRRRWTREA